MNDLDSFSDKPILGVIHLKTLPGSPKQVHLEETIEFATEEAKMYVKGGLDGIIVENFGDAPFKKTVEKMTVASMTQVISEIKETIDVPLGVNVLRNDWEAALSISKVLDLDFIRVNVFTGVVAGPEGLLEGRAAELQRFKDLHDIDTAVYADINVKHSKSLSHEDVVGEAIEAADRGNADAVIISGERTGMSVNLEELKNVKKKIDKPVLIGSGLNKENLSELLPHADGAIVGTYFKEEGEITKKISAERVESFMSSVEQLR
ncbi:MAG: BtpA/SgcQ family protein [Candidatus Natronoplasma sp.]